MPELRDSLMEIFIPFPLYPSVEQLFVSKTKQKKKKRKIKDKPHQEHTGTCATAW